MRAIGSCRSYLESLIVTYFFTFLPPLKEGPSIAVAITVRVVPVPSPRNRVIKAETIPMLITSLVANLIPSRRPHAGGGVANEVCYQSAVR
jgi:hypothetical protein